MLLQNIALSRSPTCVLLGVMIAGLATSLTSAQANILANPPAAKKKFVKPTDLPAGLPVLEAPRLWGDTFLPKSRPPAPTVLAVPLAGLKDDERIALTCLQGLLAREQPRLWLNRDALLRPSWIGKE